MGVVMTREGVSADDAHALLLQSCHQSAVPLREQAQAIVASTQRGGPLGSSY
jgi:AmiR/NasT family two-component response regulator